MEVLVNIEMVHTKKYRVHVTIDEAAVKQWAIDKYGEPEDYDPENSPELTLDEEGNEVPRIKPLDDWYLDYVHQYLEEEDANRLLHDNCHDFSNYETSHEECSVIGFEGDL